MSIILILYLAWKPVPAADRLWQGYWYVYPSRKYLFWQGRLFVHTIYLQGGDIGLFITLVPKFYNNVLLFVCIPSLATYIEFNMVGSLSFVSKRFNH